MQLKASHDREGRDALKYTENGRRFLQEEIHRGEHGCSQTKSHKQLCK